MRLAILFIGFNPFGRTTFIRHGHDKMRRLSKTTTDLCFFFRSLGPTIAALICVAAHTGSAEAQGDDFQYGLSPAYGSPVAPELDLPSLDGKRYRLSKYRGKVVIVNFWATWCPPCITEMPTLQEAWHQLHPRNFEILAVNLGEDTGTIQRFVDSFEPKLKFPILMALDQTIMDTWHIRALPTSYVIDTMGHVAYIELGPRDFSHDHVISRLKELMDTDAYE